MGCLIYGSIVILDVYYKGFGIRINCKTVFLPPTPHPPGPPPPPPPDPGRGYPKTCSGRAPACARRLAPSRSACHAAPRTPTQHPTPHPSHRLCTREAQQSPTNLTTRPGSVTEYWCQHHERQNPASMLAGARSAARVIRRPRAATWGVLRLLSDGTDGGGGGAAPAPEPAAPAPEPAISGTLPSDPSVSARRSRLEPAPRTRPPTHAQASARRHAHAHGARREEDWLLRARVTCSSCAGRCADAAAYRPCSRRREHEVRGIEVLSMPPVSRHRLARDHADAMVPCEPA